MAKSLSERLASASASDRTNLTDLEKLIADTIAERDAQSAQHVKASAEAVNFRLSEQDREDAAKLAGSAGRNAAALDAAIAELESKLQTRREADKRASIESERNAALAERDALAERFRSEWPVIIERLTALLEAVERNEDRNKACGLNVANAEAHARDIPGNWYRNGCPISQFTKIKIPNWDGNGLIWPAPAPHFNMAASIAEHQALVKAETAANAPRYIWHRAKVTHGSATPFKGKFRDGSTGIGQISNGETDIQITDTEAERLNRIPGVTVTKLDAAPKVAADFFKHPAAA